VQEDEVRTERKERAMSETPLATATPEVNLAKDVTPFESLEESLRDGGATAAIESLIEHLDKAGEYRAMLDALLLKARHELGLPLVALPPLAELTEPARSQYEEKYVAAIRLVGSRHLAQGDIPTAWAYFRAIAESEPVAEAIAAYSPSADDERLGAIIEVAFNHGVSPRRGFEMILAHYGTCPAISAFEQLPAHDQKVRVACAETLIGHLHGELTANLRAEIAARGQVVPPEGTTIADLVGSRPWLFTDEAYHIDISHLAAVVRMSLMAVDPAAIALAADLTAYGRCLSPRLVFEGSPPFERTFEDFGVYLKALLGRGSDEAIAHFQRKMSKEVQKDGEAAPAAQVLVNLLVKAGKPDAAIDVAAAHLAGMPETVLSCPSLAQLCQRAGQTQRLAQLAREQGDLVTFTAARLESSSG
jgi:hypothetical protein